MTVEITDWFIDADTHITEPGDVWTSRLPRKLRDAAPRMVRTDDGVDVWQFGSAERRIPVDATAVAGWKDPFPSIPRNLDECPPAAYDARARLAYMDEIGAWAMALYPNIGGFGSETFLGLADPELMLACVRAYDDWLIEWIAPDPRRFIPVMATSFWDAAQEVDLPISLHIGSGDFQDQLMDPARFAVHGIGPSTVSGSMSILLANAIQLMDVVMSGVLPRNPKLRVVSVESGIGWMPFVKEALDHGFAYANVGRERPEFARPPSAYMREQIWSCTFFEEFATKRFLGEIRSDRVLFETDYPHPSASTASRSARRSTRPSANSIRRPVTRSSSPTPRSSTAWNLPIGRGPAEERVPSRAMQLRSPLPEVKSRPHERTRARLRA